VTVSSVAPPASAALVAAGVRYQAPVPAEQPACRLQSAAERRPHRRLRIRFGGRVWLRRRPSHWQTDCIERPVYRVDDARGDLLVPHGTGACRTPSARADRVLGQDRESGRGSNSIPASNAASRILPRSMQHWPLAERTPTGCTPGKAIFQPLAAHTHDRGRLGRDGRDASRAARESAKASLASPGDNRQTTATPHDRERREDCEGSRGLARSIGRLPAFGLRLLCSQFVSSTRFWASAGGGRSPFRTPFARMRLACAATS
jgi:hypothetical protein